MFHFSLREIHAPFLGSFVKKNCKNLLNSSNSTNKRDLTNNFNELVTDILLSCRVLLHNNRSARKPVTIT